MSRARTRVGRLGAATATGSLVALLLPGIAVAHPDDPHGWTEDGPVVESEQHGDSAGHLPAGSRNVELVGKIDGLTAVDGGISDVAAFGDHAYLGAFHPECPGRNPGSQGGGVHVVDISQPSAPSKVAFLPAEPNSYVGEGVHVIEFEGRRYLLHNNETCNAAQPVASGFALWDVTVPTAAVKLGQYGDSTPTVTNQQYHTTHSVQGFVWQGKAYAVAQDNQELADVDIFDITSALRGTGPAVLVWEGGLESWPGAQGPYANGDTVFHHDMQQKVVGGRNLLAVSYWDAGQVLLDISNPAAPVFLGDSDFPTPDPEFPGFSFAEGNSHQSYFDQDGDWLLSSDEDFSPSRTRLSITSGPHAGQYGAGEFSWTKPIPAGGISSVGGSVWGGSGCTTDENGNGTSDRAELPSASTTGANTVVFSRGVCFFSDKVRTAEEAGYTIAVVGQSHAGTRNGLLQDGFLCGGLGSPVLGTAHGLCIGHRAMHLLFDDPPNYTGAEAFRSTGDLPAIGTRGSGISAQTVFDGWGYLSLHDARRPNLPVVDTYAVAESKDPAYASGFGNLTIHEVKTDPRRGKDLAYLSYYDAGLRVVSFGPGGITEIGHYIAEGGNDFWGVVPHCAGQCLLNHRDMGRGAQDAKRPLLLMSDRDTGLWILRYSGKE